MVLVNIATNNKAESEQPGEHQIKCPHKDCNTKFSNRTEALNHRMQDHAEQEPPESSVPDNNNPEDSDAESDSDSDMQKGIIFRIV